MVAQRISSAPHTLRRHRKRRREECYSPVRNRLIDDPTLKAADKWLLIYLTSRPDDWEPFVGDITHHCADGEDAVRAMMKRLKEKGYMQTYRLIGGDGRLVRWTTVFSETPVDGFSEKHKTVKLADFVEPETSTGEGISPDPENPDLDFPDLVPDATSPDLDFPDLASPDLENQGTTNKELNNPPDKNLTTPPTPSNCSRGESDRNSSTPDLLPSSGLSELEALPKVDLLEATPVNDQTATQMAIAGDQNPAAGDLRGVVHSTERVEARFRDQPQPVSFDEALYAIRSNKLWPLSRTQHWPKVMTAKRADDGRIRLELLPLALEAAAEYWTFLGQHEHRRKLLELFRVGTELDMDAYFAVVDAIAARKVQAEQSKERAEKRLQAALEAEETKNAGAACEQRTTPASCLASPAEPQGQVCVAAAREQLYQNRLLGQSSIKAIYPFRLAALRALRNTGFSIEQIREMVREDVLAKPEVAAAGIDLLTSGLEVGGLDREELAQWLVEAHEEGYPGANAAHVHLCGECLPLRGRDQVEVFQRVEGLEETTNSGIWSLIGQPEYLDLTDLTLKIEGSQARLRWSESALHEFIEKILPEAKASTWRESLSPTEMATLADKLAEKVRFA